IPQRIGFSAGQGFQSTFLPGYSDAPGLRSHLLLSLSVVSCFYIFPSAIAGEEDNDTNEFTQLKLKKKNLLSISSLPSYLYLAISRHAGDSRNATVRYGRNARWPTVNTTYTTSRSHASRLVRYLAIATTTAAAKPQRGRHIKKGGNLKIASAKAIRPPLRPLQMTCWQSQRSNMLHGATEQMAALKPLSSNGTRLSP
ncbi:hypothetical protein CPAR01_10397, partial [Colletotrichum paranaense]